MKRTGYFSSGLLVIVFCFCLCGNLYAQAFTQLGYSSASSSVMELGGNGTNYSTPSQISDTASNQLSGIKINQDESADDSIETPDYSSIQSINDLTNLTYSSFNEFNKALDSYLLNLSDTDTLFVTLSMSQQDNPNAIIDVYECDTGFLGGHSYADLMAKFTYSKGTLYSR